ncbi:MAG: PqqD family protein [Candidatus Desulfofervidaceae bacterium]|nr:PqqD family protein [Candidatus Desulfofervidaceae bacterium]
MDKLARLAISEEGFIFDPVSGNSFTTNKTGLFILKALKEGKGEEEIVQALTEKYETTKEGAEKDVTDFIEQLRYYRLI